jgi:LysR family hydrogen peroxide-inducible transcriptional activator
MQSTAPHAVSLRQWQYVVAVAEARSFSKAAEACHVAQPSLSAQVAQVEQALGVKLFERDKRRVLVTAEGQALIERARALLLAADELAEAAESLRDPFRGPMRVGVIPTVGPYLLPEVAPELRKLYPNLTFVWSEDKTQVLLTALRQGALDAAILALVSEVGDLPRIVLGEDPFVFAAAHSHPRLKAKRPVRVDELEGERVLLLDDGHCFREQALAVCARAGADEAAYRATSLATLVQMAADGSAVTLLPRLAVPVENRFGTLELRNFAPRAPSRTIALVYRHKAPRKLALEAVGEALARAYKRLHGKSQPR